MKSPLFIFSISYMFSDVWTRFCHPQSKKLKMSSIWFQITFGGQFFLNFFVKYHVFFFVKKFLKMGDPFHQKLIRDLLSYTVAESFQCSQQLLWKPNPKVPGKRVDWLRGWVCQSHPRSEWGKAMVWLRWVWGQIPKCLRDSFSSRSINEMCINC